jgi:nitroreductase
MIELLRNRRSIRKYTAKLIEPEKIELLKESVLRAPTSKNNKPCRFIFISDKELLHKLSEIRKPAALALTVGGMVSVCALRSGLRVGGLARFLLALGRPVIISLKIACLKSRKKRDKHINYTACYARLNSSVFV